MSNIIVSNIEDVSLNLPSTSSYNPNAQEKENANHSKLSDVSREFRELNKEIFKTVLAGDNSGLNNTNNSLGVGVFLDDTWLNKASSPDTSENFHLKLNEIKKKAQTPISKQPQPKHTFINNPLKKTNLRITTMNPYNEDIGDSLDTAEETNEKINQLYAYPVKQNNLGELNKRISFTPTHSSDYINHKSFNPSFIGSSNVNINLSTGISTNESNESFESSSNFQKIRDDRGMRSSYCYSNSAQKKINFNLALGCTMNNPMYPQMMPQFYPINPCNLNPNFIKAENYENFNHIHNLPENAFTYSNMNKFPYSEKKKKKNSKDEIDQNVFIINIENIIYGKDNRTTVMIRHIPNKYSSSCLLEEINVKFRGKYDFFYLPMDFENQCNLGYAFINFVDPLHIISFYSIFKSRKWKKYKSHKVSKCLNVKECDLSYAKFQGKVELTSHLEKSFVMNKMEDDKKPLILNPTEPLPKIEIPSEYYDIITRLYPHLVNKIIFLNK